MKCECCNQTIKKETLIKKEVPILIGYLNKCFGYNNFEPINIGTKVYEFNNSYHFEMTLLNKTGKVIQKFYKDTLRPYITFI